MTGETSVLVVDQHSEDRTRTLLHLQRFGVAAVAAGDLAELKSRAAEPGLDCIITDWQFHSLAGADLLPHLKPAGRKVFLFTRRASALTPDALGSLGVHAEVAKPGLDELLKRLFHSQIDGGARRPSVLLIDDSATVRLHLRGVVEAELPGCELIEAEDGRSGLRKFGQHRVDLAVVDLNMPGMDGATLLRTLHGNALLKKKPLLVLSSSITAELRSEWADDPLIRFLGKDAPTSELVLEMLGLIVAGRRRASGRSGLAEAGQ
jgi:two-component system chemotaxis response regulator CheY